MATGRLVISKHGKSLFLTHFGSNGRRLNHTETFTQKPSVWANIKATAKDYGQGAKIVVQDNSLLDEPRLYHVTGTGKVIADPKGVRVRKVKPVPPPKRR